MAEQVYGSHRITIGTKPKSKNPDSKDSRLYPFAIQPPLHDVDTSVVNKFSSLKIRVTGRNKTATIGWIEDPLFHIARSATRNYTEMPEPVEKLFQDLCDPLQIAVTQVVFLPEQRGNGAEM